MLDYLFVSPSCLTVVVAEDGMVVGAQNHTWADLLQNLWEPYYKC